MHQPLSLNTPREALQGPEFTSGMQGSEHVFIGGSNGTKLPTERLIETSEPHYVLISFYRDGLGSFRDCVHL